MIISPESWGINFVSKHHYTLELLKRGNRVIFLNPPNKKYLRYNADFHPDYKSLVILNSPNLLKGLNWLTFGVRKIYHQYQANIILELINDKLDIVWSFDPYRLQYLKGFKANLNIYHAMDDHKSPVENDIAESSDLIFSVSDLVKNKFKSMDKKCFKINHGVRDYFLSNKIISTKIISKEGKINVGCVGNLHYPYFDNLTFKRIIVENSDIEFSFIGPYEKSNLSLNEWNTNFVNFLKNMDNVTLIGPKPSNELPSYLVQFDLFLICYKSDLNPIHTSNNHKLLEFLSTGKVVVSHYIDEYKDKSNLLEMVETSNLLPNKFSHIINNLDYYNSKDKINIRKKYASDNSYFNQLNRIEKIINDYIVG